LALRQPAPHEHKTATADRATAHKAATAGRATEHKAATAGRETAATISENHLRIFDRYETKADRARFAVFAGFSGCFVRL
jgi:hypothetical protein